MNAASQIQRYVRGIQVRSRLAQNHFTVRQHRCASAVQALVRGWIHRNLMFKLRKKERHFLLAVPSAILIQARYRGYVQRSKLKTRKDQWVSAGKIQVAYRAAKRRESTKARWRDYVAKLRFISARNIQMQYRGWRARLLVRQKRASEMARKIAASRVIIHAWKQYKDFKAIVAYSEELIIQQTKVTQAALRHEQNEIREDLDDIDADLEENEEFMGWARERIETLRRFLDSSADRQSVIKTELEELGVKEGEREHEQTSLWRREMKDEQEWLENQTCIAKEESRLCHSQIAQSEREIVQLHYETDLLCSDLAEVCTLEFEENIKCRQRELSSRMKEKNAEWEKRVKHERSYWRVKDTRLRSREEGEG